MCYYNNQYIDGSRCAGGKNYRQGNRQCCSGPTGPTGPKGDISQNMATIVNSPNPQTLIENGVATLIADFIAGESISVGDLSNFITLTRGIYYINYSTSLTPSATGNINVGFLLNGDTIDSSITSLSPTTTEKVSVSKSFTINVLDDSVGISFINLSTISILIDRLTINIIKIGD